MRLDADHHHQQSPSSFVQAREATVSRAWPFERRSRPWACSNRRYILAMDTFARSPTTRGNRGIVDRPRSARVREKTDKLDSWQHDQSSDKVTPWLGGLAAFFLFSRTSTRSTTTPRGRPHMTAVNLNNPRLHRRALGAMLVFWLAALHQGRRSLGSEGHRRGSAPVQDLPREGA